MNSQQTQRNYFSRVCIVLLFENIVTQYSFKQTRKYKNVNIILDNSLVGSFVIVVCPFKITYDGGGNVCMYIIWSQPRVYWTIAKPAQLFNPRQFSSYKHHYYLVYTRLSFLCVYEKQSQMYKVHRKRIHRLYHGRRI